MTQVGSVGDETVMVDTWLTQTLTGDTTLTALLEDGVNGVHADSAPPGARYPMVIHQFQGGADVRGAGPFRIMVSGLWLVKAVGETRNYADLKPIADRIDFLLQARSGTALGGYIFSSVRESPFHMSEVTVDVPVKTYKYLGGTFRILAQLPA